VRTLRECVDAGICSSGAVNADRLAKNALKGTLHMVLDRISVRLALPTGEWSAVVSHDYLQSSGHGKIPVIAVSEW
jgi:hypothetical protein